jgi:hypothetical protein
MDQLRKQTGRSWVGFSTELPETHDVLWRQIMARLGLDQPKPPAAAPDRVEADAKGAAASERE